MARPELLYTVMDNTIWEMLSSTDILDKETEEEEGEGNVAAAKLMEPIDQLEDPIPVIFSLANCNNLLAN